MRRIFLIGHHDVWMFLKPKTSYIWLVIMPLVSWAKLRVAREIPSAALRAEAKETLACSYLSFALLLGLVANAAAGWWWADPVAALLMVPWLLKEGVEGIRGESCEEHDDGCAS